MLWTLLLVVAGIVVARRFGSGVLAAILAAIWLAGVAGLWQRHQGGQGLMPSDLWVPAAGLAALGAGYAALIGRLRRRVREQQPAGAGLTVARPRGRAEPPAPPTVSPVEAASVREAMPADPA